MKNRRAARDLFHFAHRDLFEKHLWRICEYVVDAYISTAFADSSIEKADKGILIRYYKWVCFGAVMDMPRGGMKDDMQAIYYRMGQLKEGMLEEMINRSVRENAD